MDRRHALVGAATGTVLASVVGLLALQTGGATVALVYGVGVGSLVSGGVAGWRSGARYASPGINGIGAAGLAVVALFAVLLGAVALRTADGAGAVFSVYVTTAVSFIPLFALVPVFVGAGYVAGRAGGTARDTLRPRGIAD
ncbi:hypothetical protein [Halosegnis marinus]|uniref:Uncharacterized protein n=1 Tax=Halosegnis marinus TaxID=3034023 RepID=A0ABD5ZLH7_9EURY|nr:hypothetical protein [Halosegnis sp. DT85]